jgi:hypothetical protein
MNNFLKYGYLLPLCTFALVVETTLLGVNSFDTDLARGDCERIVSRLNDETYSPRKEMLENASELCSRLDDIQYAVPREVDLVELETFLKKHVDVDPIPVPFLKKVVDQLLVEVQHKIQDEQKTKNK